MQLVAKFKEILYMEFRATLNSQPQWMEERGVFGAFIYSYYVNYDHCGTTVAAFENAF